MGEECVVLLCLFQLLLSLCVLLLPHRGCCHSYLPAETRESCCSWSCPAVSCYLLGKCLSCRVFLFPHHCSHASSSFLSFFAFYSVLCFSSSPWLLRFWFVFANSPIRFLLSFCLQVNLFPGSQLLGLKCPVCTAREGAVERGGLLLWPGSQQRWCVADNGVHPTVAAGFPAGACLNDVTLVLWIGQYAHSVAESAVVWQKIRLSFGSYCGSGRRGPPGLFSSSIWEVERKSASEAPVLCWLMLQSSCYLSVWANHCCDDLSPLVFELMLSAAGFLLPADFWELPCSCLGLGREAVVDTILLLSLEFCPLLLL